MKEVSLKLVNVFTAALTHERIYGKDEPPKNFPMPVTIELQAPNGKVFCASVAVLEFDKSQLENYLKE